MLGALVSLVYAVGAACLGYLLVRRLIGGLDPALRIGLAGMIGLGAIGTLTLFIGFVPGGLSTAGIAVVWLVVVAAGVWLFRGGIAKPKLETPAGVRLLFPAGIGVALLFGLVSVLAPSDTVEWDSLAYHLAVPKLWLSAGHLYPIRYIHQSNFPLDVDNLYIWGLAWGGESGAKAFTLAFAVFGILAVFGLARQLYGALGGWWAALAWSTIPVVVWLSGTAYIDVQNGLYAGLGIAFAAIWVRDRETHFAWLAGIMLGLATGSKYTGIQTIFAVGIVLAIALVFAKERRLPWKALALICILPLAIASPWYVKNEIWNGNPVYPFFYKELGGKNWASWNAEIYENEQQSFGVARSSPGGKIEPERVGHAILGLAYQPGRYVNPGQTSGLGFPIGSIGFVPVCVLLLWLISGESTPFESAIAGAVLISLAMWFVLSEQSRYIVTLAVPLTILAGGAVERLRIGRLLAAGVVVQALASLYIDKVYRFDMQIQVVTGKVSPEDYMKSTIPFYEPAQWINQNVPKTGRVALYDEVFGYLLDVPYFWANPGHTTILGYSHMTNGRDLIDSFRRLGITDVYVNLMPAGTNPNDASFKRWISAMGLNGDPDPYTPTEREAILSSPDMNQRERMVLAEAIASGSLRIEKAYGSRLIFHVA